MCAGKIYVFYYPDHTFIDALCTCALRPLRKITFVMIIVQKFATISLRKTWILPINSGARYKRVLVAESKENVTVRELDEEEATTNGEETIEIAAKVHPPPRAQRTSGIPRPVDNSPVLRRVVNSPQSRAPQLKDNPPKDIPGLNLPTSGLTTYARLFVREEIHTLQD